MTNPSRAGRLRPGLRTIAALSVSVVVLSAGGVFARADGLGPFVSEKVAAIPPPENGCEARRGAGLVGTGSDQSSASACSANASSAPNQKINPDVTQAIRQSGVARARSVVVSNNVTAGSGGAATSPTAGRAVPPSAPPAAGNAGTFAVCADNDPALARRIASYIGNHQFSASLTGRSDGCAALIITLGPPAAPGASIKQNTAMSVGAGAGAPISVRIESANGATSVYLGAAS